MGLLSESPVLSWEESQPWLEHVRSKGIIQFIHNFQLHQHRNGDPRTFGDELEMMCVASPSPMDSPHEKSPDLTVSLWPYGHDIIEELNKETDGEELNPGKWLYEYASYMIEVIPLQPFAEDLSQSLPFVLKSLQQRVQFLRKRLPPHVYLALLTNYPLLGMKEQLSAQILSTHTQSSHDCPRNCDDSTIAGTVHCFIPDVLICKHARFPTLTKNIRQRRGNTPVIHVPKYLNPQDSILLDGFINGMGCCCLQTTFQCRNLQECLWLYDVLIPVAPWMLALSAGCAAFKGELSGWDCRWNVVSATSDDRFPSEPFNKSRYASSSMYLLEEHAHLNDEPIPQHTEAHDQMIQAGIPRLISQHIASLFARDPIAIYRDLLSQPTEDTGHFDSFQSTNWHSLRFKLPPKGNGKEEGGWRIEFRVMDVQLRVEDNARLIIFMTLLVRALVDLKDKDFARLATDWFISISQVDVNFDLAHQNDAITNEMFIFGKERRLLRDIFRENVLPLLRSSLTDLDTNEAQLVAMDAINFVYERLNGISPTNAKIQRDFYLNHPEYKQDGRVTVRMVADFINTIVY